MREVDLFEMPPPPRRAEWAQSPTLPLPPPRDRGELGSGPNFSPGRRVPSHSIRMTVGIQPARRSHTFPACPMEK